jgi:hypothetical protein
MLSPEPISVDDRLNVMRMVAAGVLDYMTLAIERHCQQRPCEFYEVHLARGLSISLGELAEGDLKPHHFARLEAELPALVGELLQRAVAVLESPGDPAAA